MARVFESQQPMLFKGCIDDVDFKDAIGWFPEEQQNMFPFCDGKRTRDWRFEDLHGKTKDIVEQVPCAPSTLREKIESFDAHDIDVNGSYFEVHARLAMGEETALLDARLPRPLTVERMQVPAVTHFLHAGTTSVYYLHAHPDHFLSFCLQEEKRWTLISPQYYRHFDSVWSGNAQMMLRERAAAPRIAVTQKRGDILYVPPWWLHETKVVPGAKNVGVNVHWMAPDQVAGIAISLFARIMGNPQWWYS
mmetsp:Transcript_24156/g.72476  ORF Transcript_24156/g.72476 Transcript_24156/m.72476 type:complete len:249 (+) Transcript_24156:53-799(+)